MKTNTIETKLSYSQGTEGYHKHLFSDKSPIMLTDGCKYVRDACDAYCLFDAILSYQCEKILRDVNFQIWVIDKVALLPSEYRL